MENSWKTHGIPMEFHYNNLVDTMDRVMYVYAVGKKIFWRKTKFAQVNNFFFYTFFSV